MQLVEKWVENVKSHTALWFWPMQLSMSSIKRQNSVSGLKDYASQESPRGAGKFSFASVAQQVVLEQRRGSVR